MSRRKFDDAWVKHLGITYQNGCFNIVIYSIPLAYKGEYCENMF